MELKLGYMVICILWHLEGNSPGSQFSLSKNNKLVSGKLVEILVKMFTLNYHFNGRKLQDLFCLLRLTKTMTSFFQML